VVKKVEGIDYVSYKERSFEQVRDIYNISAHTIFTALTRKQLHINEKKWRLRV